ncbi:hypothetical protein Tco_0947216 [Tanacetum coccineum]
MWMEAECMYDISATYGISHWWYDYMKQIVLRRADNQEYTIAENDFKDLYPSDFEDLYLLNLQGHLNHLPPRDRKILSSAVNLSINESVIPTMVEDFQLRHREDKYGMQMLMRFNEIHKFSDDTLQQIDEALDYWVKEFKVNKNNLALNTSSRESSGTWKALLVEEYAKESYRRSRKPNDDILFVASRTSCLDYIMMEMQIPHSSIVKFIATCSYSRLNDFKPSRKNDPKLSQTLISTSSLARIRRIFLNGYGISVPALTKDHKGNKFNTPYLVKLNTPYWRYSM